MIVCAGCESPNESDAEFCDQCGHSLEGRCPDCNGRVETLENGEGKCVECGVALVPKDRKSRQADVNEDDGGPDETEPKTT